MPPIPNSPTSISETERPVFETVTKPPEGVQAFPVQLIGLRAEESPPDYIVGRVVLVMNEL